VDGDPPHVSGDEFTFPGMDARTDLKAPSHCRIDHAQGATDRPGGTIEDGEAAVAEARKEAQALIARYFETYAGVRRYREQALAEARATGVVTTLFGRKRYVRDVNADNRNVRAYAERVALNTPIQGSAADLIKRAMLVVDRQLSEERLASRLILQVHDELLFEAPEGEVERLAALACAAMERVATLSVPLKAEVGVGRTWAEAH
jgi:DNA polymerase I